MSVRPVNKTEEPRYRKLMQQHHYPGDLAKIGHSLWYVASYDEEWAALLSFSAAAWKCGVRDLWIGWDSRRQYGRPGLIANNSRFLILPTWHYPNRRSKVLSLCQRRLNANWNYPGQTQGYRRTREGYSAQDSSPEVVFVRALLQDTQAQLSRPLLRPSISTPNSENDADR